LATDIIHTNDSNYLLTSATANIGGQSFWVKTDSEMGKIWDLCWPEFYLSYLGKTVQSATGNYYTSAGSPTGSTFTNAPKIYKFDQNGMPIKVIDSLKPQVGGFVLPGPICMFNDTVVVAGFSFEVNNSPNNRSSYLVVTDSSGKKLEEIPLTNSKNTPAEIIKTFDGKLMVLYQNENSDIAICKFEYTNPNTYLYYSGLNPAILVYDSLCNEPIASDTTALTPLVITDIHEYLTKNKVKATIDIWPNPGSISIHVGLNQVVNNGDMLLVVNEMGQTIKTVSIGNSSLQLDIDITPLPQGMYVLQHVRQGSVLGYGKLIVGRE
ncbi:MAG: hypothetical protein ACOYN4_14235, partial [Bacteroidales bacterium]